VERHRARDGVQSASVAVREEHEATRCRVQKVRPTEEVDAGHLRHPLTGHQQSDLLALFLQSPQSGQCRQPGPGGNDAIIGAVPAAQVTGQPQQAIPVVVNGEQHRSTHPPPPPSLPPPLPSFAADRHGMAGGCRSGRKFNAGSPR
jgi:hypothetical protein